MSILRVSRDGGFADRVRKYKVIVKGIEIGQIENGETKEFKVEPGKHEVYLKIDWCRSNKVQIEVKEEQVVELSGGSSLRGFKLMFSIFYIIAAPNKYLWLSA